ncbi:MAG: trypsin-like serine protease [Gilvibacter sp.]
MIKHFLVIFFVLFQFSMFGQTERVCTTCGPEGQADNRTFIPVSQRTDTPYNGVVKLNVKRWIGGAYGTASAIAKDMLITANHNVMWDPFLRYLTFTVGDQDYFLRKSDYKVYHYHQGLIHKKTKDIAIIKITNPTKFLPENTTYFAPSLTPANDQEYSYTMVGCPCDKQGEFMSKSATQEGVRQDLDSRFLVYPNLYTCTGDSGAALWYENNGAYNLVSIHHGKRSFAGLTGSKNAGIKITQDVLNWIEGLR